MIVIIIIITITITTIIIIIIIRTIAIIIILVIISAISYNFINIFETISYIHVNSRKKNCKKPIYNLFRIKRGYFKSTEELLPNTLFLKK